MPLVELSREMVSVDNNALATSTAQYIPPFFLDNTLHMRLH
jgi:hypothetical protein